MQHLRVARLATARWQCLPRTSPRSVRAYHNTRRPLLANSLHQLNRPNVLPQRSFTRSVHTNVQDDTIYALSTAPGRAAIAIIRISGPSALQVYSSLCPTSPASKPRTATLRRLQHPFTNESLDTALVLYFPAPHTATGEDLLELHVHGGNAIVRGVLASLPACGTSIRPAEPGEFTRRAFYNGRIDLTEVEALGETLAAETEQQRRLAVSGASSALTRRYEQWRTLLLDARGEIEALIDFSEDQHFDESPAQLMAGTSDLVMRLSSQIEGHILNASRGELLRSGISIALLGAPNAGKSSLLNLVVGREAAIVSAEEGTTRDIVDVGVDLQGWLVRLGDMAGVRGRVLQSVGMVEQEGIRRARERALQSDLVVVMLSLQMVDGSVALAVNDELLSAVSECRDAGKQMIVVLNKIDLLHDQTKMVSLSKILGQLIELFPVHANDVFCISCKDGEPEGLQNFLSGLTEKFRQMTTAVGGAHDTSVAEAQTYWNASLSVTHRQSEYLRQCLGHLNDFLGLNGVDKQNAPVQEQKRAKISAQSQSGTHFFDTTDQYHTDGHEDIVAEIKPIPYSWNTTSANDLGEIDIVTAAEHLRDAANCLAKLTGRGDVSSGTDVEDVLGVVFDKFCVGK